MPGTRIHATHPKTLLRTRPTSSATRPAHAQPPKASTGWIPTGAKAAANPHLGAIDPSKLPTTADRYKKGSDGPNHSVAIHVLPQMPIQGKPRQPVLFTTAMMIDADGAGNAYKSDPDGQPQTSLTDRQGHSLDPTKTPYFVLPEGFTRKHPGIKAGDVAAVMYRGKISYAILGDFGPSKQIGEGSIALAKSLGIPANPTQGGVTDGVTYVVFPGSGNGQPLSNAEIEARASELLRAAGGQP